MMSRFLFAAAIATAAIVVMPAASDAGSRRHHGDAVSADRKGCFMTGLLGRREGGLFGRRDGGLFGSRAHRGDRAVVDSAPKK